jgi:DNA primase
MMGLERDIKTILDRAFGKGLLSRDGINYALCCPACDDSRRGKKKLIVRLDDGRLNYYVTRTIDATKKMKYQNADVPKAEVIFNEIDMDWSKEVLLVEGVFDAIKCPENTLPILGSSFSKRSMILRTLMKHQTPCVVSLDPDMKQKAYRAADLLVSAGCPVRIAFAPTGKDLGDLTKSEVSKLVKSAPAYNDMMRITHKISEIKSGSLL